MDTNINSRPYNMKMSPRKTECAVKYQYSASSNKFGRVEGPTHRVSAPAMPLGDENFCRSVTFTSVRDLGAHCTSHRLKLQGRLAFKAPSLAATSLQAVKFLYYHKVGCQLPLQQQYRLPHTTTHRETMIQQVFLHVESPVS